MLALLCRATSICARCSCTSWWRAIALPCWLRSLAYSTAASRQSSITPTHPAATLRRPLRSVCIATAKPSPSAPSMFSTGIRYSVTSNMPVSQVGMPSLAVIASRSMPSPSVSMMNALMRRLPAPGFSG